MSHNAFCNYSRFCGVAIVSGIHTNLLTLVAMVLYFLMCVGRLIKLQGEMELLQVVTPIGNVQSDTCYASVSQIVTVLERSIRYLREMDTYGSCTWLHTSSTLSYCNSIRIYAGDVEFLRSGWFEGDVDSSSNKRKHFPTYIMAKKLSILDCDWNTDLATIIQ